MAPRSVSAACVAPPEHDPTVKKDLLAALAACSLLVAGVLVNLPTDRPDPGPVRSASSPTSPWESPDREIVDGSTGVPDRIEIETLEIDAPVEPVGTTPENAQEVPAALDETGWWRDGALPGENGNAVIVGHTASSDDGVFDRLVDIESGDEILVTGEDGTAAFTVTETDVVPVPDFATVAPDVYRSDGASGLVLMTCGDWNGEEFETTVIVFAERA